MKMKAREDFFRIKYETPKGKIVTRWAVKTETKSSLILCYRLVNKEGENSEKGNIVIHKLFFAFPGDIIEEKKAIINPKYCELEIV